MMPGFNDAHVQFGPRGAEKISVHLVGTKKRLAILDSSFPGDPLL